ncbi:DNA adenine methylase [Lysinibacillus capsici]|uniref:DNA adenine methylase n=1 Tax=Lysinibacillus capsici TaxID=2115968 RepID=UPI0037F25F6F
MSNNTKVPQLIKWIGNKHKFADEIISYMPEYIDTYFEPFLGSGAILAQLAHSQINDLIPTTKFNRGIASDVLEPLVSIFEIVKKNPENLIKYYEEQINEFNLNREEKYLEIRDRFNQTRNPMDFLLLTRTCYSGIVRFRKKDGYMSTPIGPHKPIPPEEFSKRVNIWNQLLQNVQFFNSDYKNMMALATEGDLVYCDPPYTHSQTIIYGAHSFNINELFDEIASCKKRGVKVMLSLNGAKKSGMEDVSIQPPEGLFERIIDVSCGISMINRLQRSGERMVGEEVTDVLMLTW